MQPDSLMTFRCPNCDAALEVPIEMAGISGPCPKCSVNITAPQAEAQQVQKPKPLQKSEVTLPSGKLPAGKVNSTLGDFRWAQVGFLCAFLITSLILIVVVIQAAGLANVWNLNSEDSSPEFTSEQIKKTPVHNDDVEPDVVKNIPISEEEIPNPPVSEDSEVPSQVEITKPVQIQKPEEKAPTIELKDDFPELIPPKFDDPKPDDEVKPSE